MSSTPASPRIEHLLQHAGWIRALARRLSHDPASADDLEQQTWLAALEHPPGEGPTIRQWLAAVMRNFARQARRGEGRRRDQEQRAARAENSPSVADVVERAAVQRELVEAVLALDEPYRTAVLLRWFEGLAPRAIAVELGVPVETVHTRLQRGLALLRRRLDTAYGGDRRAWIVALVPFAASTSPLVPFGTSTAPLVPPASLAPVALGALLMNAKLKLTLGVVAVLALLTAWYVVSESPAPTAALASAPVPVELAAAAVPTTAARTQTRADELTPAAASERSAAPTETKPTPALAEAPAPAPAMLRGKVLDANGAPAAEVEIGLDEGPRMTPGVATRSGPDGRFELVPPATSGRLVALSPKLATVLAGVYHAGPGKSEPIVVVAPRAMVAGRVADEDGNALAGAEVVVDLPEGFRTRFTQVLDYSVDVQRRSTSDAQGHFRIEIAPRIEGVVVAARLDGFEPFRAELAAFSGENLTITLARPRAKDGMVRGRVLDAAGSPVEGARVAFGVASTRSEKDGGFAFKLEDPRSANARFKVVPATLLAVKKGHQAVTYTAPQSGGKPAWPPAVVLRLGDPPLSIEGRVVDHRGTPIAAAKVWLADATFFGDGGNGPAHVENILAGDEKAFWHFVLTGEDGAFRLDGLLGREYHVRAMDPKTLLRAEEGPLAAGARGVEIRLATDTLYPRVAGFIVSHTGDPIAKASVFPMCDAFQARFQGQIIGTSHDALDGVVTDEKGRFELENVPKSLVYLRIEGEDILPLEYGRYVEGDGRFAANDIKELPREKIEELVIAVDRRCHFQVELADPTAADEIAVLDEGGRELTINVFLGNGRRENPRAPIVDGRSHPMAVSDTGRTLVVYKSRVEIVRVPLALTPGTLKQVKL